MSKIYGKQSSYLLKKDLKYYLIAILPILVVLLILYILTKNFSFFIGKGLNFIFIFAVIFILLLKIFDVISDEFLKKSNKFHHGRMGEYDIYKELKKLSDEYLIFQNILLPNINNDIDFIIVGPTGVYTIEVKSHKGNIGYNGQQLTLNGKVFEKDFLKQAMFEAMSLREYIKEKIRKEIYINSLLVFSSPYASLRFGFNPVNNVVVIGKAFLLKFFNEQPVHFNDIEINKLKDLMMPLVGA